MASTVPPSAAVGALAPETIQVHVAGAVVRPGLYRLDAGSRVADAVTAAGGATVDGNLDGVNLAAPVADGERVLVPALGEAVGPTGAEESTGGSGPVRVNTADVATLDRLPGVGPATAAAIVEHRERHGPFERVEQLLDVPGIGPAKLDGLRSEVVVP